MTEKLEAQLTAITKTIPLEKISQGAEAIVYRTRTHPYLPTAEVLARTNSEASVTGSYIVKYRPPKAYRHPTLDAQLTKHRTLAEARLLHKLGLLGVSVPRLIAADTRKGLLWMEDVGNNEVEVFDNEELEEHDSGANGSVKIWIWKQEAEHAGVSEETMRPVLLKVGEEVGKLHTHEVVHGDLTTSNIILRDDGKSLVPVLIDFGLGSQSTLAEDKAVDLYVLERAVNSTHPVHSDTYNQWLLEGYQAAYKDKNKLKDVMRKLEDVRMRGRKRSMEG
ncbi:hypothetical protein D0Z00_001190 [Geotrichum galactomycetum]|uniref:Uncharacterized protein n=1 Tax=Geotrichum galactomycetum TaxID=27317 RepID=A0ACB6V7N7_9ASCO|nr:hypothetical protein D0Z00_001190 [Geotrichum candidum]